MNLKDGVWEWAGGLDFWEMGSFQNGRLLLKWGVEVGVLDPFPNYEKKHVETQKSNTWLAGAM